MRALDISGLVSLNKYFTRAAQWTAWLVLYAALATFFPEFPDHASMALLALVSAVTWFVLSRGHFAAAWIVVPMQAALIVYLLLQHWAAMSSPARDSEVGGIVLLLIFLYVPVQAGLGLLLPECQAAVRSPHARAVFDPSSADDSLSARTLRWLRRLRPLPVAVVILMLLVIVGVAAVTSGQSREQSQTTRQALKALLGAVGGAALVWARRRAARRGSVVRRTDPRPPVLLLRSFGDDMLALERGAKWTRPTDVARHGMTFERIVAKQLAPFGPVIAIGKPGEALAPLGAARDYVTDDAWQGEVEQRMREAVLVVLMLGSTEGLAWELLRVHRLALLRKLVLLFPPATNLEHRWRTLRSRAVVDTAAILPEVRDPRRVLAVVWDAAGQPLTLEGRRTEWAYETALRIAANLAHPRAA